VDQFAVPAGTDRRCVELQEAVSEGDVEFKVYRLGVVILPESTVDRQTELRSHM
jgi:hypothetical protein